MNVNLWQSVWNAVPECCLTISSHTSDPLLFISLYLILFSTSLAPSLSSTLSLSLSLPKSRKRATTSFLSKTKNQIENDRTLSFSIAHCGAGAGSWELSMETPRGTGSRQLSGRWLLKGKGRAHAVSTRHSHLSKQVPTQRQMQSRRRRQRLRGNGVPLCCYCVAAQQSCRIQVDSARGQRELEKGPKEGGTPCLGVGVAWKCAFALQVGREVHIFKNGEWRSI